MPKNNKTVPLLGLSAVVVGAGIAKEIWGMRTVKCPVCNRRLSASQIRKCKICKAQGCPNCVDYMHRFLENSIEKYFEDHTQLFDFSGILIKILSDKLNLYGEYCTTHANQAIDKRWDMATNEGVAYASIDAILDKFFVDFDRIKVYEAETDLNMVVDAFIKETETGELSNYTSLEVKKIDEKLDWSCLVSLDTEVERIVKKDKSLTLLDALIYTKFFASSHGHDIVFDFIYQGKTVSAKLGRLKSGSVDSLKVI